MRVRRLVLCAVTLLFICCYGGLLCKLYDPAQKWERDLAPWFGQPQEVLDLEEVDLISHYRVAVRAEQVEAWKQCLKNAHVKLEDSPDGFCSTAPFVLYDGNHNCLVDSCFVRRMGGKETAPHFELEIEQSGVAQHEQGKKLPSLAVQYPEYVVPDYVGNLLFVAYVALPLIITLLLLLIISPSSWCGAGWKFLLKGAILCCVVNVAVFVLILFGCFGPFFIDSGVLIIFGQVFYCAMMVLLWLIFAGLLLGLRCMWHKVKSQGKKKGDSCDA